jgi:hypothetical protein
MHARQHAWLPTKVIKKEKDWGLRRFDGDLGRAQMEQEVGMTQSTNLGTGIGRSMADLVVQIFESGVAIADLVVQNP